MYPLEFWAPQIPWKSQTITQTDIVPLIYEPISQSSLKKVFSQDSLERVERIVMNYRGKVVFIDKGS